MNHRIAVLLAGYAVIAVVTWCLLAYRNGRENLHTPLVLIFPDALLWPVTLIVYVIVKVLEAVCAVFVPLYNCCYEYGRRKRNGTK